MTTSRIVGISSAGVLVIAFALNLGRVALGQKEENPARGDKGAVASAGKFAELNNDEREIAEKIGRRAARLEMLNLALANQKHALRRYNDLEIDLELQSRANPPGLSARESEERVARLDRQSTIVVEQMKNLTGQLDSVVAELTTERVELYLLAKKNGLPDLTSQPAADLSLESIERNLKAIEAKLPRPTDNAK